MKRLVIFGKPVLLDLSTYQITYLNLIKCDRRCTYQKGALRKYMLKQWMSYLDIISTFHI